MKTQSIRSHKNAAYTMYFARSRRV